MYRRQKNHILMIPLHYLRANARNITRRQFECDVTCFFVLISFVQMHSAVAVP